MVQPHAVQTPFGTQMQDMKVEIDENVLKQIAQMTGGITSGPPTGKGLSRFTNRLINLEKTKIEVTEISKKRKSFEHAFLAIVALALDIIIERLPG